MKPRPQGSIPTGKHCTKCGHTNHSTGEYKIGMNRCYSCGAPNHIIANCPVRPTLPGKEYAQGSKQGKSTAPATARQMGRVYAINKK